MMDLVGKPIIIFRMQGVIVLLLVEVRLLKYLKEKNFMRPALEDAALWYGLLMVHNKRCSPPDFPMSYLHPSHYGKKGQSCLQ